MPASQFVLTLACPDRPGIVAAVSSFLFEAGLNILDAQQFNDTETDRFFMRTLFDAQGETRDVARLRLQFEQIADRFGMAWQIRDRKERRRVMLMASKSDHCLADILYRWRIGELPMDITAIVSNHPLETYRAIDFDGIAFHHLPIAAATKSAQEDAIWALFQETKSELVVLARYMQILSDSFAAKVSGRCINIHHSFLPGFKGAKPYHQAHARGVKLIGATAHFVTAELDEGPIIEQDVERISHRDTPDDLVRKGRDIERRVLSRALLHHLEDRVILNGAKTVVFGG